jgi:hypothetical protein
MLKKALVINALPRSGSNILWNIIGSSPDVQMTQDEFHGLTGHFGNIAIRAMMRLNALAPSRPLMHQHIRQSVFKSADMALQAKSQKFDERGIDPAETRFVCFKVMGGDNRFNDLISYSFPESFFVFLTRDEAGICDSYCRRGLAPEAAARMYANSIDRMKETARREKSFLWVQFEDLFTDLQQEIDRIYTHFGLRYPTDNLYLYKEKGFGPGQEESSKLSHKKTLLGLNAFKDVMEFKPREYYIERIPKPYWETFQATLEARPEARRA